MSEWKVFYRDHLDQDRMSRAVTSKEDALRKARSLHREQRAVIYRIEGPNGGVLRNEDVMRWVSANRW